MTDAEFNKMDLEDLQSIIAEMLADKIYELGQTEPALMELQPPSTICELAAQAAAAVLIAFERGYRMDKGGPTLNAGDLAMPAQVKVSADAPPSA